MTKRASRVKYTLPSKYKMYLNFQAALYREPDDPLRFSYPADHPLPTEFEEQMTALVREYKGNGKFLSVHHPDTPGRLQGAHDATALCLMGAAKGAIRGHFIRGG
ncbi:hypothetical protein [Anatilimnocola floriformis]|uniref:hypothetical protein n=1 Tax=Anatilimnocola floriformis TaxID=2948575 RepID=UPI0020C3CA4B|nr:hypothetical protein [Anatilimnocola floriformis]